MTIHDEKREAMAKAFADVIDATPGWRPTLSPRDAIAYRLARAVLDSGLMVIEADHVTVTNGQSTL